MLSKIRKLALTRRGRADLIRTISSAGQPQRDELIVMAQRQGLL